MGDQARDVPVDGRFEGGVVRVRADVMGQFADEIAQVRRKPRLQLGIAASALDNALKVTQRVLARGPGIARGRNRKALDPRNFFAQAQSRGLCLRKELVGRREQFGVQAGAPRQFNSAREQPPLRVVLDGLLDDLPDAIDDVDNGPALFHRNRQMDPAHAVNMQRRDFDDLAVFDRN
jgi:hypothetical protein